MWVIVRSIFFNLKKLARMIVIFSIAVFSSRSFAAQDRCQIANHSDGSSTLHPNLPATFWQPTGALRKVRDGLALTVVRKVSLFGPDGSALGEITGRCRLVYDLWAETYQVSDVINQKPFEQKFPGAQGQQALSLCVSVPMPRFPFSHAHVTALVNPVDAHQEERTRTWLATKGIGGPGNGIVGRALGAVIDLKTETTVDYDCTH